MRLFAVLSTWHDFIWRLYQEGLLLAIAGCKHHGGAEVSVGLPWVCQLPLAPACLAKGCEVAPLGLCAPHAVSIPLPVVPRHWRSGAEGDPQPAQMCCSWCRHPAAAEANLACRAPIAVGDAQSRKNSLRLRAQMSLGMSGHRNHLLVSGA